MSRSLPLRANLDWLKKEAKELLAQLRAANPEAQLAEAQLALARDYGFASWRKLKSHVETLRDTLNVLSPRPDGAAAPNAVIVFPDDDPDVPRLYAAIHAGDLPAFNALLQTRPELAKAAGRGGQTPLHAAAFADDPRMAITLLVCGADPNVRYGHGGHTPLSWAATCNSRHFAAAMLKLGYKPDLFCAAGVGGLEHVLAHFAEDGTLQPGASRTGSSRLNAATGEQLPPVDTATESISDALYIACRNGRREIVEFLLTKNPDLNFKAFAGGTPLHWAYFGGSAEIVQLLLDAGANPAATDDVVGCTPRAFAVFTPANWGFLLLVQERLAQHPDLATAIDSGTTALHQAARSGSAATVRFLLQAGADRTQVDRDGRTPAQLAKQAGHAELIELLRE